MLITVDPQSGVPIYRQLMDQVKFHIASGLLRPGDNLPSTRALSAELGVNPMTISKAYSFLEKEDLVERRPGRPVVVKAQDQNQTQQKKSEQLRQSLAPIATMARQLGLERDRALQIFASLLNGETPADPAAGRNNKS